MSYVDPFKDLNDTKRKEREALLNHPEFGQVARNSPPVVIPPVISRRDYFAAAALQGLMDNTRNLKVSDLVEDAILLADALIAELDGEEKP